MDKLKHKDIIIQIQNVGNSTELSSFFTLKNGIKTRGVCVTYRLKKDLRDILTKCNEWLSFGSLFKQTV